MDQTRINFFLNFNKKKIKIFKLKFQNDFFIKKKNNNKSGCFFLIKNTKNLNSIKNKQLSRFNTCFNSNLIIYKSSFLTTFFF